MPPSVSSLGTVDPVVAGSRRTNRRHASNAVAVLRSVMRSLLWVAWSLGAPVDPRQHTALHGRRDGRVPARDGRDGTRTGGPHGHVVVR